MGIPGRRSTIVSTAPGWTIIGMSLRMRDLLEMGDPNMREPRGDARECRLLAACCGEDEPFLAEDKLGCDLEVPKVPDGDGKGEEEDEDDFDSL